MTIAAWRFAKAKHADTVSSGEGARKFGGRWNSPGTPIVYTASGISLATLELLIHLEDVSILPSYVLFRLDFKEDLVETVDESKFPTDWRASPSPESVKAIGDNWFLQSRSAVLSVPSAVTPGESNYLLNPAHSEFHKVKISGPLEHEFDPRIMDLSKT